MTTSIMNEPNVGDSQQREAFAQPPKPATFSEIALLDEAVRTALNKLTASALELTKKEWTSPPVHIEGVVPAPTEQKTGMGRQRLCAKLVNAPGNPVEVWESRGRKRSVNWIEIPFHDLRKGDLFRLWDKKDSVWLPDVIQDGYHQICVALTDPEPWTNENGESTLFVQTVPVNLEMPTFEKRDFSQISMGASVRPVEECTVCREKGCEHLKG
jgi:hypothetical protein